MLLNKVLSAFLLANLASGFVPHHKIKTSPNTIKTTFQNYPQLQTTSTSRSIPLFLSDDNDGLSREDRLIKDASKTKGRVDPETRKKLLAESIAPWRTLRLFFYISLGSGAALGGFITLAGVLAALSGAKGDVDLSTEYLNLAIDFGAVFAFVALSKFDLDKKAELDENVEKKLNRKKEQNKISKAMRDREAALKKLNVSIRVTAEGDTQEATVGAIQDGANQHMIFVIGNRKCIKDALLGANLLKLDFSMSNVLVVPYEIGVSNEEKKTRPTGGFAERPVWETQAYVAEPIGEGWEDYIEGELKDAVEQSGPMVKQEGVAIVLANDGNVIRRGVGKVPWRQMVEELESKNAVAEREKEYGLL